MRRYLLLFYIPTVIFATDVSNYQQQQKPQSKAEQLQAVTQERDRIRKRLSEIPAIQKNIEAMQQTIARALKSQRKMAEFYVKINKHCIVQKAKHELAGLNSQKINSEYQKCQKAIENNPVLQQHDQFMADLKKFKDTIKEQIVDNELLVGEKDQLELMGQYTDEAFLMLEEQQTK